MKFGIPAILPSVILSLAAATGALALDGPGRALVPSNALKLSADTVRATIPSSSLPVMKEFIVPYAGTVRFKWQSKSDGSGKTASVVIRSSIAACASNVTASSYQNSTCDLRVMAGDMVTVSAAGEYDSMTGLTSVASMRHVRIYFNLVDSTGTGEVLMD